MFRFLPIEWYESLPSTNTSLEERISDGEKLPAGVVIAAREQTAGRGRYNRSWFTGSNRNLAFSMLFKFYEKQDELLSLSMACAVGIAKHLRSLGIQAELKWPNDILVRNQKLCGILTKQITNTEDEHSYVIVGCGVNVNMEKNDTEKIDQAATSLKIESGKEFDLENLLQDVLASIAVAVSKWEENGFIGIRGEWEELHKPVGSEITVKEGQILQQGILVGFGQKGELLLKDDVEETHRILQGDVYYDGR